MACPIGLGRVAFVGQDFCEIVIDEAGVKAWLAPKRVQLGEGFWKCVPNHYGLRRDTTGLVAECTLSL